MNAHTIVLIAALAVASPSAIAAPDEDSFLGQYAATDRFRLGRPASFRPTPDGNSMLFLRSGARDRVRDLYELDLNSGKERVLLTARQLLAGEQEQLSAEELARRERQRLSARGIVSFRLSADGKRILLPLSGRLFLFDRESGAVRELRSRGGAAIDARLSPDAKRVACVRDGELWLIDVATGDEKRLTRGAGDGITHGLSEFVAQEEMSRSRGYWWGPDSRRIVYQRTDTRELEIMNIMDPTHPEQAPASWPYPRPGKANATVRLFLTTIDGGEPLSIDWDHERYEYLASVKWPREAPMTILVQNREQTEQALLRVDPATGGTTPLLIERDEAWVEIDQSVPLWLERGDGFLWTTERDGEPQLELRSEDGALLRKLTPPGFGFQALEHFFRDRRRVVVRASADPTQSHLFDIDLKRPSRAPAPRTRGEAVYFVDGPKSASHFAVSHSDANGARRFEIHDFKGATALTVRSAAETPPLQPRLEFTTVGAQPSFPAVLIRPADFDSTARYPVIVHVYGGPTSRMVRRDASRYLLDQWFADRGFVVIAIDGRGTPFGRRAWTRAVKHDLIETPLDDQVEALQALGRRYEELDLARVGIYGWSFGGYFSAMAVMRRPDVFHVGVAGAPVVDWADYDTHYTERYMGLPQRNPEGYAAANVLTYAEQLRRPLLLIHGTDDDNVYFQHSLKLANALFRAGKSFDFLPLAGFTHMVADPVVTQRLYRRILQQFEANLGPTDEELSSTAP